MKTKILLFFQLVTQCNAKYVECFSAQKECNKEKNRNSSVVPCKKDLKISLTWLSVLVFFLSVLVFFFPHWILCKDADTTKENDYVQDD